MNALTIDVEDWYHDAAGFGLEPPPSPEARVDRNLRRLLDLLEKARTRATLFVLGEVAERFPALVRDAAARGHEIASHGHEHRPLGSYLRREFREDVRRSIGVLTDIVGAPVVGYRAPYFSIKAGVRWPTEVLAGEGLRYDSSILPIDRPPGLELVTPRIPYRLADGLWEVPIAVHRWVFWNLPFFGGFSLRALPEAFLLRRLDEFNRDCGPAVVHLHPWEIDSAGPEVERTSATVRAFKRYGRGGLEARLQRLLAVRPFGSIGEAFPDVAGAAVSPIPRA